MNQTVLFRPFAQLLLAALLVGCAAVEAKSSIPQQTTEPIAVAQSMTPAAEATDWDGLVALLPDVAPVEDDCLACHSDVDLLQALGEEEDVPEVPSEGSG